MVRFVFVTGGVVSSLGKGLAAASLGAILESRGLKVELIKLDPYINVDPGTMSPFQHGEVYVTEDGAETDLDLGHYERFVRITASKHNNYTAGQIYLNVIKKERDGSYLGGTVQVVPHITDEIQDCIKTSAKDADIALVEIGGTVGDIESLPFLEAIRQMRIKLGRQKTLFVHLTLVPYLAASDEMKTKPTQHAVKELRSIGIQPDCLLCRVDRILPDNARAKMALFTNVEEQSIISAVDIDNIYKIPGELHRQSLDTIVLEQFGIKAPAADLSEWNNFIAATEHPEQQVNVAMVGKYTDSVDSYKSLSEALYHAGGHTRTKVNITYVDSERVEQDGVCHIDGVDAILIPGGFGHRGIGGKVCTVRYARENAVPFLGICLGMQVAVIEIARNLAHLEGAHSTEFDQDTLHPVVGLITEWKDQDSKLQKRSKDSQLGGTMRLGGQDCRLVKDSLVYSIYKSNIITERYRHRYEFNNKYRDILGKVGLNMSGISVGQDLVEVIELPAHPWFIGCQFHPEFKSTPRDGHPLFSSFIKAACDYATSGRVGNTKDAIM